MSINMSFSGFVGRDDAKLALVLNAIDRRCGGVLFLGEKGCGKSTLARRFRRLLPRGIPFVELPLNATEEGLMGGIDLEKTIREGRRCFQPGILSRAHDGFVYIDDIHLLPVEILALTLNVQGRGENLVEKEGLTLRHAAEFQLLASMDPAENFLPPHLLDCFGMAVVWGKITEAAQRAAIVRQAMPDLFPESPEAGRRDRVLAERIGVARSRLAGMKISAGVEDCMAGKCLESRMAGHRGDVFLFYAARAHAALMGKDRVEPADVDAVTPLVLNHRRRQLPPENEPEQSEKREPRPPPENNPKDQKSAAADRQSHPGGDNQGDEKTLPEKRESLPMEAVFESGEPFPLRRFHYRRDRIKRGSSGRKIKSLSRDKRGRYIRSAERGLDGDIAIDATVRAAAPLQRLRGGDGRLVIRPGDIRYKRREKKVSHLAIFVVDGSGSMGAQRRMVATKGAIQSLLLDSYQKRDKVAMIVFRKDRAELVLPPTSSAELASRCLRQMPVGGRTPLSAGLLAAHDLVRRMGRREPGLRFLVALITDGRANHCLGGATPEKEVSKIAGLMRELPSTEFLVVDTENKAGLIRMGLAGRLAAQLAADYCRMEELESDRLLAFVQSRW
ncbi:MAG: VWA domain-containing protein [Verrucomicrobiae bacterium]|nr:VWA domain-containing protein [Verrucomicrobiae bacterium]